MRRELTAICKRLNQHVPVKRKEDVDALNDICGEAFNTIKDFGIYFDRDLYVNCDCDYDKCKHRDFHPCNGYRKHVVKLLAHGKK